MDDVDEELAEDARDKEDDDDEPATGDAGQDATCENDDAAGGAVGPVDIIGGAGVVDKLIGKTGVGASRVDVDPEGQANDHKRDPRVNVALGASHGLTSSGKAFGREKNPTRICFLKASNSSATLSRLCAVV